MSQASHGLSQVVGDKRPHNRSGGLTVCKQFLSLLIIEESLDLGTLSVRDHSVLHALFHGLGSLEHGEHWDSLAGEGVDHEALKDGELV